MIVKGHVTMSLTLNVYDLETDNVYIDRYGKVKIDDPNLFFIDWCKNWEKGIGELLGASSLSEDLEKDGKHLEELQKLQSELDKL